MKITVEKYEYMPGSDEIADKIVYMLKELNVIDCNNISILEKNNFLIK